MVLMNFELPAPSIVVLKQSRSVGEKTIHSIGYHQELLKINSINLQSPIDV